MKHAISFLFLQWFLSYTVLADVPYRITNPKHLEHPVAQNMMVYVPGSQVAYFNRFALERDFPFTRQFSDPEMEQWILKEFAFISRYQSVLNNIRQSPIPRSQDYWRTRKMGYRPKDYGRAVVHRVGSDLPLVDVKGAGLAIWNKIVQQSHQYITDRSHEQRLDLLRTKDHSDGLMSLGEAIAELTRQSATQVLFDEHNAKNRTAFETVETYFIISLPFSILKKNGEHIPAALYGRQAHSGRVFYYDAPPKIYRDHAGSQQSDSLKTAAADFGGVLVLDPRLEKNYSELEGKSASNPQETKPWAWGHEVAKAFIQGHKRAVYTHLQEMLDPVANVVPATPKPTMSFYDALKKLIMSSKQLVQIDGIRILKNLNDPTFLSLLKIVSEDINRIVRARAIEALENYDGPEVGAMLQKALEDPKEEVRKAAQSVLKKKQQLPERSNVYTQLDSNSHPLFPHSRKKLCSVLSKL
ncbi:MAG: HEAT repeat domain-containing protein [Bdellovibrionales bacterium]